MSGSAMQRSTRSGAASRRERDRVNVSRPHDAAEREASHAADAVSGGSAGLSLSRMAVAPVQRQRGDPGARGPLAHARGEETALPAQHSPDDVSRSSTRDAAPGHAPAAPVRQALASAGQPLDAETRGTMETRFGHDFGRVRIHTDARAQESARALDARAYTTGSDVVIGPGGFNPRTPQGRQLLAHELAHVVQQADAPPAAAPHVQRLGVFETIGVFLGLIEGNFSDRELREYLDKVTRANKIEDSFDSDNKARAIVRKWKNHDAAFQLTADQKVLLIKEMLDGVVLGGDENAIIDLIELGNDADRLAIFGANGVTLPALEKKIGGKERKRLDRVMTDKFKGGRDAVLAGTIEPVGDQGGNTARGQANRQDFVFLMGADPKGAANQFFTTAKRYFRVHLPNATMIEDKRSLADVLAFIRDNVSAPIGTLYIVTHANEDGTLSFALDSADTDAHLSVTELRTALQAGTGKTKLASVAGKIDRQTSIEIKGCDLGRTREMVELIDLAFGGAGVVTAPTHEQGYEADSDLGIAARKAFRAKIAAAHPEPAPVAPKLKGAEKRAAQSERKKALAERKKAIEAEITARAAEEQKIVDEATVVQSLSGPMFQRPGTQLFTVAEIRTEVDRLYGHLDERRRKTMAAQLAAPDRRSQATVDANGVVGQQGQRLYRKEPFSVTIVDPQTVAEAKIAFGALFARDHFTPKSFAPSTVPTEIVLRGTYTPPKGTPFDDIYTVTVAEAPPTDAEILAGGRAQLNNPDRYRFRVDRRHDAKTGKTRIVAVAERVLAYLHHGSLDRTPEEPFLPPETDPRFFTKSTTEPPAATPPSGAKK